MRNAGHGDALDHFRDYFIVKYCNAGFQLLSLRDGPVECATVGRLKYTRKCHGGVKIYIEYIGR